MRAFTCADQRHLDAAEGWPWREANDELEQVTPELRGDPEVLRVRYSVFAAAGKWEMAAEVARAFSERAPKSAFGFVHQAYALHELKRTRDAEAVLLAVVDKFPHAHIIRYNLACYAAQLGDLKAARAWLQKAIDLAGTSRIELMALDDPDLEALWKGMGEI